MKISFLWVLLVAGILSFVGCAPTASFVKVEAFTSNNNLVVLPVLAPADISSIATFAIEKQLTANGHKYVSAGKVREMLLADGLLDEYNSFIEKQNSLGIVDSKFFKKLEGLGSNFMVVKVTDWAQGGNFLTETLMKSGFQRTIEASIRKVSPGETLVGLSASVYSISGDLVYHDTSEAKLSAPFKQPTFEVVAEMAAWKFGMTLPK